MKEVKDSSADSDLVKVSASICITILERKRTNLFKPIQLVIIFYLIIYKKFTAWDCDGVFLIFGGYFAKSIVNFPWPTLQSFLIT